MSKWDSILDSIDDNLAALSGKIHAYEKLIDEIESNHTQEDLFDEFIERMKIEIELYELMYRNDKECFDAICELRDKEIQADYEVKL